jgi:aspartyl-tRNA(Asn)/glutamyl-tRNA(Gln) amidotransferase subunit A
VLVAESTPNLASQTTSFPACTAKVEAYLQAIRQQQHLNAFVEVYEAEAREQASLIDEKIRSGTAGPLAGLVVGIKDVFAHRNHPVQAASRILTGYISPYNATVVERLLAADAIIIGRQNCDEFAMGSSNENSAFGPVKNAVDPTRVPGGSSGGSAVAVQAGLCDVSIGSDTGGSVRQPAAFCGLYGLKPTYGRISRYGLLAYASSFDCVGVLAFHLDHLTRVLQVIAGPDEHDSTVSSEPVPVFSNSAEPKKYRIAFIREATESDAIQPEIKRALEDKISQFHAAGHQVEAVDFPLLPYVLPTYYVLVTAEASANLSRYDGVRYGHRAANASDIHALYKKSRAQGFGKEVQRRILLGTYVLSAEYYDAYYIQAQKVRRRIREATRALFHHHDFVLMPTTPTTAFRLGELTADPVQMYLADLYSVQANVAGVPAISVPCGSDRQQLPIGLQLMADDFQEKKLLDFVRQTQNT